MSIESECGNEEMEGEVKGEHKRKSRNLSEKKRRDQFNILINELCSMVNYELTGETEQLEQQSSSSQMSVQSPNSVNYQKKMDKSSILRSTITFLKNHSEMTNMEDDGNDPDNDGHKQMPHSSEDHTLISAWKPSFISNEEFTNLILEALDAFIIIIEANVKGKVIYASETIMSLLGINPSQFIPSDDQSKQNKTNQITIYDLIQDTEKEVVEKMLKEKPQDELNNSFISVWLHFKQLHSNSDKQYGELIRLLGAFHKFYEPENNVFGNHVDQCFVAIGRLQTPKLTRELRILPLNSPGDGFGSIKKSEFISRHSLEWKFLFLDHRAPPIIGYLPFELLGTSGYDYYHWDDLDKIVAGHEQLMQTGEGVSCHYRFLTKGQQWIWLQTRYYIAYNQWNSKAEFIICTHSIVNNPNIEEPNQNNKTRSSNDRKSKTDQFDSKGNNQIISEEEVKPKVENPVSISVTPSSSISNNQTQDFILPNNQESDLNVPNHESKTDKSPEPPPPQIDENHIQIHDFLLKKHHLLKHQIQLQLDELRKVSEQLRLFQFSSSKNSPENDSCEKDDNQ